MATVAERNAQASAEANAIPSRHRIGRRGDSMSMDQPGDQRPRCDCCGEFLSPEHVPVREGMKVLELQAQNLARIATQIVALVRGHGFSA